MTPMLLLLEALVAGLLAVFNQLVVDFAKCIADLARAFPNLVKMGDIITRFATGLVSRAVDIPFKGAAEMLIKRIGPDASRLIRVDDAIRMFMRGPSEILQEITLTDESGLVGFLLGYVGRFLYRTGKKIRLLSYLIKAKDEVEFVELIVKSWTKKLRLVWYVALAVGGLALLVSISAAVSITALCIVWIKDLQNEYILPQDSGFKTHTKPHTVRKNLKKGPDAHS